MHKEQQTSKWIRLLVGLNGHAVLFRQQIRMSIDSVYSFHQPLLEVLGFFLSYSLPFLHLDHKGKRNGLCHLEQHKYTHIQH